MFDSNVLLFAQLLGFVSYGLGVFCFYQKDDKRLKISMLVMNLNNTLHFALLGAVTASIGSILSVFRTGVALKTSSQSVAIAFIVISFLIGLNFSEHWYDLFPILGTCIGTYALFCLKGVNMRIAFLCGTFCWLSNNIIVGSIGGTLLELTLLIVNGNTIRHLLIQNKNELNEVIR